MFEKVINKWVSFVLKRWKIHLMLFQVAESHFTPHVKSSKIRLHSVQEAVRKNDGGPEPPWRQQGGLRPFYLLHIHKLLGCFCYFICPPVVFILFSLRVSDRNVLTSSLTSRNPATVEIYLPRPTRGRSAYVTARLTLTRTRRHTRDSPERKKLAAPLTNLCTFSPATESPRCWIRFAYSSSPIFKGLR